MKKNKPNYPSAIASCLLTILLGLSACSNENVLHHSYRSIEPAGWKRYDTLSYTMPIPFIPTSHHFEIGIRHKDSYPYRDLWLTINNDTLHVYLADSIGHWKGNGIGNLRQHVIHVQPDVLASDSVSTFQVVHIMQDSILQDITDIGIRISELHQ